MVVAQRLPMTFSYPTAPAWRMHRILPALLLTLLFVPAAAAGPAEDALQTSCVYPFQPGPQGAPLTVSSPGPGQVAVAVDAGVATFGVGVDLSSCI